MHAFTVPLILVAVVLSAWWLIVVLRNPESPLASKIIAIVALFLSFSAIAIHYTIGITESNTVELAGKDTPEATVEQKIITEKTRKTTVVVKPKTEARVIVEKARKTVEDLKAETDKQTLQKVTEDSDAQLERLIQSINN